MAKFIVSHIQDLPDKQHNYNIWDTPCSNRLELHNNQEDIEKRHN